MNHQKTIKRIVLIISVLCVTNAGAKEKPTWEQVMKATEKRADVYKAKYPKVRSERIVFKTVKLANGKVLDLDLHIERPMGDGPFPVVFYVHGGGWGGGSKSQFTHQSFELADHGIAGVRMEYRLKGPGVKFPEAISDVMDSIDFIRKKADELDLDFTKVGLAGGSAGGHLSAIAAQLTPECVCYDGFNGLFDVVDRDGSNFGGGDYTGKTKEEKKKASAFHMVKATPPDTFLYHGTKDNTVKIKQSHRFAEAIIKKGGNAEVLSYEGAGHSFFNKEPYLNATTQAMLSHVSFVFGLTDVKPVLSDYSIPAAK
ncbi:MAG: alpha/beta hydrolase [Akkermansiaceae bacterium]